MTSRKKSGSSSSSGKRKPPKPPLPGEDPKLIHSISQRSSGGVDVKNSKGIVIVGGDDVKSLIWIYASKYLRFGKRQIARYLGLFLGLIGLGIALYFIWQYFLK